MSAFVPSSLPFTANRKCYTPSTCDRVAAARPCMAPATTSYFLSTAFGSPVTNRPAAPKAPNALHMDVTVVVGDNEPVESALRRFKRDVVKSGHLFELRRRRYFETNTEKRLRKAAASKRKAKMARIASKRTN